MEPVTDLDRLRSVQAQPALFIASTPSDPQLQRSRSMRHNRVRYLVAASSSVSTANRSEPDARPRENTRLVQIKLRRGHVSSGVLVFRYYS